MSNAIEHPVVTWLLPVKNAMPFLTQTLRSMVEQAYPNHRVLAWDNGSTDGSAEELRRWIGPGRPLSGEVVSDRPLGLGAALARMVERVDTELCARIDGDDVNLPARLEKQVAFLLANPRVAVVGTGLRVIDEGGELVSDLPASPVDDAALRWHLRFGNALAHPSVMFRRSAILAVGNYRDMMPGQDYDLWCRVAERFPMANLAEPLVCYRMHGGSVTAANLPRSREIAQAIQQDHREQLWPGLDPMSLARLRRLLAEPGDLGVTLQDWRNLRDVASRAALRSGEPPRYFRRTTRYREQAGCLLTRCAKRQPGVRTVWPALRALRRRLPMPVRPTAHVVAYRPLRDAA